MSTAEQREAGHSLGAQAQAIREESQRRGWRLLRVESDVASGKSADNRAGLQRALAALRAGEADALMVCRLDRLSRSLAFTASLLEECGSGRTRTIGSGRTRRKVGPWRLVVLDTNGIDMTSAQGELLANVLASVARMQRRLIAENVREGLAYAKQHGTKTGRAIGRPRVLGDDVRALVVRLRRAGKSWNAIGAVLKERGIKPAHGGARWHASAVRKVWLSATTAKPKGGKGRRRGHVG